MSFSRLFGAVFFSFLFVIIIIIILLSFLDFAMPYICVCVFFGDIPIYIYTIMSNVRPDKSKSDLSNTIVNIYVLTCIITTLYFLPGGNAVM